MLGNVDLNNTIQMRKLVQILCSLLVRLTTSCRLVPLPQHFCRMQFLKLVKIPWLRALIIAHRAFISIFIEVQSIWRRSVLITMLIYILGNWPIVLWRSGHLPLWLWLNTSIFLKICLLIFRLKSAVGFHMFLSTLVSILMFSFTKWLGFMMSGVIQLATWSRYLLLIHRHWHRCCWSSSCILSSSIFVSLLFFFLLSPGLPLTSPLLFLCRCLSICWERSQRLSSLLIPKHIHLSILILWFHLCPCSIIWLAYIRWPCSICIHCQHLLVVVIIVRHSLISINLL